MEIPLLRLVLKTSWQRINQKKALKVTTLAFLVQLVVDQAHKFSYSATAQQLNQFDIIDQLSISHEPQIVSDSALNYAPKIIGPLGFRLSSNQKKFSEILDIFDNIEVQLQAAITKFGYDTYSNQVAGQVANIRSNDIIGKRPQCTISKDKLIGLKNEVENVLANVTTTESAINCELDLMNSSSENCDDLIKLIQCGVFNIKIAFSNALNNQASLDELIKLQNAYDDLIQRYNKEIDDAKNSATQESQEILDQLKTELQTSRNELNEALEKLKDTRIDFCASEIHSGRIESAYNTFKALNDDSLLPTIIKMAYNRLSDADKNNPAKKLNNVRNILAFRLKLPLIPQYISLFETLFNAMQENKHFDSPEVLPFYDAVKEFMTFPNHIAVDRENKLTSIRDKLAPYAKNIILAWASRKDYKQITNYAKTSSVSGGNINDLLPDIFRIVYNINNFDSLVNFINNFSTHQLKATAFKAFISEMQRNQHFSDSRAIRLAYKIRQAGFNELQSYFPNLIKNLIWRGSDCTIRSKHYNEYLYAATDRYAFDRDRRRVFTWGPKELVRQGYWTITPENDGTSFNIRNTLSDEYLYSANYKAFGDRRQVFTWRPRNLDFDAHWLLTAATDGVSFTIYNTHWREYLYASGNHVFDRDRRNVFTWRLGGDITNEMYWVIQCFGSSV